MLEHSKRCPARPKGSPKGKRALGDSGLSSTSLAQSDTNAGEKRDFRVECAVCGRLFSRDRIGKHQKICRSLSWNKESTRAFQEKGKGGVEPADNSAVYTKGEGTLHRRTGPGTQPPGARMPQAIPCELCGKGFFPASMKVR